MMMAGAVPGVIPGSSPITGISGGGGGASPIRHGVGVQQPRAAPRRSRDLGTMDPAGFPGAAVTPPATGGAASGMVNGLGGPVPSTAGATMAGAAMSGAATTMGMSPLGGIAGIPGMSPLSNSSHDRLGWGGMVGSNPYGMADHHQQQHHGLQQQQAYSQHMQFQQQQRFVSQGRIGGAVPGMPMGMGGGGGPMTGMAGIPGMGAGMMGGGLAGLSGMSLGGMGNMGNMGGMAASMNNLHNSLGPHTKKKIKKPSPPAVKDKNCPKRPRNSYIFFTLMKR